MWQSNLSTLARPERYRSVKNLSRMILSLFVLFLAPWLTSPCNAEIYKYQDDQGRWHITDKPPSGKEVPEVKLEEEEKESAPTSGDLAEKLRKKFQPISSIEQASLAVVAIKTPLVEGSGFFISDDGYILTNKHIVKPTKTPVWKELQGELKERGEALKKTDKILRSERARLNKMEKALKDYREEIDGARDNYAKRVAEEDYSLFMNRYLEHKSEYEDIKRDYTLSKKEYEQERREINIQSYSETFRKDFKIILKDNTEVTARLISISDKDDLALLKLERYKTPFLLPTDNKLLSQGSAIFVIGNPLGIKDIITSGVVAGFKDEYVITDATVLPGNSGGPLLTDAGKVAGIISIRVSQVVGGEGFGVAISIDTAYTEFSEYINYIED